MNVICEVRRPPSEAPGPRPGEPPFAAASLDLV